MSSVANEPVMPAHLQGWPLQGNSQQQFAPNKCPQQNWCGTKTPQQQQLEKQGGGDAATGTGTSGSGCFASGADVVRNLVCVNQKVDAAAARACRAAHRPRVVAVSKLVPTGLIQVAHNAGQRAFGENYVEELIFKAQNLPSDIEWHFLGHLTADNARQLVEGVPNLFVVESVDSTEVALALHQSAHRALQEGSRTTPLPVYLQVNTTGDASLAGVRADPSMPSADDVVALARFVSEQCPALCLAGLMAIGGPADEAHDNGKADFKILRDTRAALAIATHRPEEAFQLSMGITQDFEDAIAFGSTSVRIGTAVFGTRPDVGANVDENQREVEMREH